MLSVHSLLRCATDAQEPRALKRCMHPRGPSRSKDSPLPLEVTGSTLRGFGTFSTLFPKVRSPVVVILEVILTLFYNDP